MVIGRNERVSCTGDLLTPGSSQWGTRAESLSIDYSIRTNSPHVFWAVQVKWLTLVNYAIARCPPQALLDIGDDQFAPATLFIPSNNFGPTF